MAKILKQTISAETSAELDAQVCGTVEGIRGHKEQADYRLRKDSATCTEGVAQ